MIARPSPDLFPSVDASVSYFACLFASFRSGVGPPPVAIYKLTAADLENAICVLQTEAVQDAAERAGSRLRQVDGLGTAVQHIYRGLLARAVLQSSPRNVGRRE
jgi:hypothetical protein